MKKNNILKKERVAVLEGKQATGAILYATRHGSEYGHELITCKNCGEIYCYDIADAAYLKPIDQKLEEQNCVQCNKPLLETATPYPEYYVGADGTLYKANLDSYRWKEERVIKEFWNLYTAEHEDALKRYEENKKKRVSVPGRPGWWHSPNNEEEE